MQMITRNPQETESKGKKFGEELLKVKNLSRAIVLALEGELGSGKTTFVQGIAKGLQIRFRIVSPTFVITKRYEFQNRQRNFYHIDCYRVKGKELVSLGLKEMIKQPKNIIAIEWADRIPGLLPKDVIKIKFEYFGKDIRKISFN